MSAYLCPDIWSCIAEQLADETSWMICKRRWPRPLRLHPLRALSQVSRTLRKIAFRKMWRHIKFDATDENFERNLLNLDQLCLELDSDKLADLSPRRYLHSLEIDIRFVTEYHEDAEPSFEGYERIHCEYDYLSYHRLRNDKLNIDLARDCECWDPIETYIQKCLAPLRDCPNLSKIIWTSPSPPPMSVLYDLQLLSGLQTLHLDFRGSTLCDCTSQWAEEEWQPPQEGHSDRISPPLSATLCIDAWKPNEYGRSSAPDDKLSSSNHELGADFAKWLAICRSLTVNAPGLWIQPWMVPVWAQLDDLQFSAADGDVAHASNPYASAALQFRPLLQESGVLDAADPRGIFDLIHRHESLAPWRAWFPSWPGEETPKVTALSTKTILTETLRRARAL